MLVRLDQTRISSREQDHWRSHRRGFKHPRRYLPHVVFGLNRVGIEAELFVWHRSAAGRFQLPILRLDRAIEIEHVRSALRAENGTARANEVIPGGAVEALVVGPFDVMRDAALGADRAHPPSDLKLVECQPAIVPADIAASITDHGRTIAQRPARFPPLSQLLGDISRQDSDEIRLRKHLARVDPLQHGRRHASQRRVVADLPHRAAQLIRALVFILHRQQPDPSECFQLRQVIRTHIAIDRQAGAVALENSVEIVEVEGNFGPASDMNIAHIPRRMPRDGVEVFGGGRDEVRSVVVGNQKPAAHRHCLG